MCFGVPSSLPIALAYKIDCIAIDYSSSSPIKHDVITKLSFVAHPYVIIVVTRKNTQY